MTTTNLYFIIWLIFISSAEITKSSGEFGLLNESTDNQVPIIEGDHIVNATRGKMISMKCIVHNIKNYKIAWYFGGALLTLNNMRIISDKRYSIENPQPNEWKLTIDPVDSKDEGQYYCMLNSGKKKSTSLKVGVPPSFTGNNGSHQIVINTIEKQNITLSCEADGNPAPTIYWYRNGKLITTGPHLFIKEINKHSHSEYECVARNTIEPDPSRHFKINVNFKPTLNLMYYLKDQNIKNTKSASIRNSNNEIMNRLEDLSLNSVSDGDLQIVCEIVGNPVHSVNWFKDNYKLRDDLNSNQLHANPSQNSKLLTHRSNSGLSSSNESKKKKKVISIHTTQVAPHKFVSKLKIKNYDHFDNGVYKCSVVGFEGDVSKTITINDIPSKSSVESNDNEYTFNSDKNLIKLNSNKQHDRVSSSKSSASTAADTYRASINKLETLDSSVNSIKNADNKNNNNNKINELKYDDKNNLVESSYLQGRGTRSNLTKLNNDVSYKFDERNSAFRINIFDKLIYFVFMSITTATTVCLLHIF